MYKVIRIEEKEIPMASNGGTLRKYRRFFHRDMLIDFLRIKKAIDKNNYDDFEITELVENISWIMAKEADPDIEDIDKWLEQFKEPLSLINNFKKISSLLGSTMQATVKPKNRKSQQQHRKR